MKTLRFLTVFLAVVFAWPHVAAAQVNIDSTTLSSAVQPGQTNVTLGSVTCTGCTFGAGTTLFVNTEQMIVAGTYVSGASNIPVIRAKQTGHASGATVFLGPANRFYKSDPPPGLCNKIAQTPYYPWINVVTGYEWLCDNGQNAYSTVNWRALIPYTLGTIAGSR